MRKSYREGRELCATFGKVKLTKSEAKSAAKQAKGARGGVHAYLCGCGCWHVGHMPSWRRQQKPKRSPLDA